MSKAAWWAITVAASVVMASGGKALSPEDAAVADPVFRARFSAYERCLTDEVIRQPETAGKAVGPIFDACRAPEDSMIARMLELPGFGYRPDEREAIRQKVRLDTLDRAYDKAMARRKP